MDYTTEENDQLAVDFEVALKAELARRGVPATEFEVVNFSNINIDIRFRFDPYQNTFFNYMGIGWFRKRILVNETLEQYVARFVERWLVDKRADCLDVVKNRAESLKRADQSGSYRAMLENELEAAKRILAWLLDEPPSPRG